MIEIEELRGKFPEKVKAILNIMIESPYFYREDHEELFAFLRRYRQEFDDFYQLYYGWNLILDNKCARVYKEQWYNDRITPSNRMQFRFSKRDECIAFMLLLEFYEHQLEEQSITADDTINMRFRFGNLLAFCHQRFTDLFENQKHKYTEEYVRASVLRQVMPRLIRFRFLREIPRPPGMNLRIDDTIYEALPALYHYNAGCLSRDLLLDEQDVINDDELSDDEDDEDLTDEMTTDMETLDLPLDIEPEEADFPQPDFRSETDIEEQNGQKS